MQRKAFLSFILAKRTRIGNRRAARQKSSQGTVSPFQNCLKIFCLKNGVFCALWSGVLMPLRRIWHWTQCASVTTTILQMILYRNHIKMVSNTLVLWKWEEHANRTVRSGENEILHFPFATRNSSGRTIVYFSQASLIVCKDSSHIVCQWAGFSTATRTLEKCQAILSLWTTVVRTGSGSQWE